VAAAGSLALYLLYFYVPISTGHTVPLNGLRPLGDWSLDRPLPVVALLAFVVAGLFALYAFAYLRLRGAGEGSTRARAVVYGAAAAASLTLMFLPSLLSKDVFDYMVQGRLLAIHRANPFTTTAQAFAPDDFVRAMGWPQFTTLYGPAWVSAAGILAFVSPGTLGGSLLVYKILFAVVHLLNGALVGALRRGWGRPGLQGELLYLWNPLVVLQVCGDAHNDAFLMMWVLLGLFFMQRAGRSADLYERALGVICFSVSILIKYVTAPFLLLALAARIRGEQGKGRLLRAGSLALIAGAVVVLGFLPYARGMDLLGILRPYQMGHYQGGLLMVLSMAASRFFPSANAEALSETASRIMGLASGALTLLLALWSLRVLLRVRRDADVPGSGLLVLLPYLLGVTALLRISYGVWLVPLAALLAPGPLRRASLLFSSSLFALELYWVYALRMPGGVTSLHRVQASATLVAVGVPILYLLAVWITRPRAVRASDRRSRPEVT
jgi:hypothetical protein